MELLRSEFAVLQEQALGILHACMRDGQLTVSVCRECSMMRVRVQHALLLHIAGCRKKFCESGGLAKLVDFIGNKASWALPTSACLAS